MSTLPTMHTYHVTLGSRSYPIYIGAGLLNHLGTLVPHAISGQNIVIITNETVAPLYLDAVQNALSSFKILPIILPDGEQYKAAGTMDLIYTQLLENRVDRNATILALGGGVVGDIAGFAAATYQRGVKFIQIPTTLLSQVDSSVGGKTGINHPLGKNMIGAFYQPKLVVIDTETLNTLPDREISAGLAEIIKYGLIRDPMFFNWLEKHIDQLKNRDSEALIQAIEKSCANKAQVVAEDETEKGVRAILNLGHTFGHAIETGLGYGRWLHGEAVGCGMIVAAKLSEARGWLTAKDIQRIKNLIAQANLPTILPKELTPDRMLELMAVDKKVLDGAQRLVLMKGIGDAVITADTPPEMIINTLQQSYA